MAVEKIKKIAVIGAGSMGHGIAQSALLAGLRVYLYDNDKSNLQMGTNKIHAGLDKMASKGQISENDAQEFKNNLSPTTNLEEAVSNVDFVFEAVPEVLEIKQDVFQQLDELTSKDVILATNTSNMFISSIAERARCKERIVGLHFFIPVVLMKIVEVISGKDTSKETMQTAYDLCVKLNKIPVRVEKDSPGFIVNRINGPVRVYLGAVVDEEIAEPEEIDALMRYHGLPIGHFELSDYIGLDVVNFSAQYRKKVLHPDYAPNKKLLEKLEAKQFGKKTGKGYYDWSNGKPSIDIAKRTDKIKIEDLEIVKFNEAAKLIEDEIADPQDIDTAMVLGTGYKAGPIEYVSKLDLNEVIDRLEYLSTRFNKEILKPANILRKNPDVVFQSVKNI
ncbi:3-hydroxybutyryl-CoA dehydrogenase [Pueribacillus theae]|uniref:3-hydroxybutyryl-CoA dehydrogenase n=1 Tax=Pueribacillus theae TaxID=2171751 RepID=A0A2U1JZ04_9BACI|nr:3-hydroxyacyl-CoA dehydrogenase [Pueribacillus theae]PWA10372.1 3-hydroxybutyryl-CoA dehydrogenase [Pueribacillus theae]